jgi:hypothetical protein
MPISNDRQRIRELEEEVHRVRTALSVAKRWLARFCDRSSDVWQSPVLAPHEVACEALTDVRIAEES